MAPLAAPGPDRYNAAMIQIPTRRNHGPKGPARFEVWQQRRQEYAEARERERSRVLAALGEALEQVAPRYRWDELYIFGSVARPGVFTERSDVDVLVKGLDKLLHLGLIADLSARLGLYVDVVRWEDCHFADLIPPRAIRWTPSESRSS